MRRLTVEELCKILEHAYDEIYTVQEIVNKLEGFDAKDWGTVNERDKSEVVKFWSQYLPKTYNPLYA